MLAARIKKLFSARTPKTHRKNSNLRLECLEDRMLLHGGHVHESLLDTPPALASSPTPPSPAMPLFDSTVPAYSSLPGARATLYLDFDGHFEPSWGRYRDIRTPAFDTDGRPSSFSSAEQVRIREIWQRVAEDFAPFNLNVTTVSPRSFANGVAMRVAIGGRSFTGREISGVAFLDSFTNSLPNTVYAFSQRMLNNPKRIADASSHEAGHAFGLEHQSRFDGFGNKVEEYNTGIPAKAPLMGRSYRSTRSTWWYGSSTSATRFQDDMAIIAGSRNGFGYRRDEAGQTLRTAGSLSRKGTSVQGSGVVAKRTDADWWSFSSGGGRISIGISAVPVGPNLDAKVALLKVNGSQVQTVTSVNPANSFGGVIRAMLRAGKYILVVTSSGLIGDVGQYTIRGTVPAGSRDPDEAADLFSRTAPASPAPAKAVDAVFHTEALPSRQAAAAEATHPPTLTAGREYTRAVARVLAEKPELWETWVVLSPVTWV